MRILQVSKYYPPYFGGVEQVVSDITTGINSTKELKCDVLAVNHEKSYIKEEKSDYFIYRSKPFLELFSTPISLSFLNMYRKLCTNYDLIHIHLPNPLSTLGAFLFRSKAKIVLHWHSDIIKQKKTSETF